MKKTLLFLLVSILMLPFVSAQSLVVKEKSGIDVSGQTIEQYCVPGHGDGSRALDVYNIGNETKSVKVKKYDISLVDSVYSHFCWLSCYPDFITISPDSIFIDAGSFSTNFTGDLTYKSVKGTSKIKFVFFDSENETDSTFVIIDFIIGTVGINDLPKLANVEMSNAYPNPVMGVSFIDYKLPQSVAGAYIRINNLLGTTVREIPLDRSQGKVTLDAGNLKDGVYFYSLIVNKSATITRKFVVKR
jgi:hypothetical protein